MARILICHVPKDGSVARDLGAALMGRGHFVSFDGEPDAPRAERSTRLKQFEAVAVVWTEGSVQSQGLFDIASETMPMNLLVPIRADSLAPARIHLKFRKLNMLSPGDIDGIARLVARLSTAVASLKEMSERDATRRPPEPASWRPASPPPLPAPAPSRDLAHVPPPLARAPEPPPILAAEAARRARPLSSLPEALPRVDEGEEPPARALPPFARAAEPAKARSEGRVEPQIREPQPVRRPEPPPAVEVGLSADDLAHAVDAGLIALHIPDAMWLGEPVTVEIRLGGHALGEGEIAGLSLAERDCIETLSLSLYGNADAFEIERQSERTQFIGSRPARGTRDRETFGRWAWLVTPRSAGAQDLVLRISALLRDRRGVPTPVALPDRCFEVDIQVPEGAGLMSALAGWRRR